MTATSEELVVGVYIRWTRISEGWGGSWDIVGKIVDRFTADYLHGPVERISVLGYDDLKTNTASLKTLEEEATIVTKEMARSYFEERSLSRKKKVLDKEFELAEAKRVVQEWDDARVNHFS